MADLLRSGCFHVPMHQRYYDWEMEHVDTLLLDLVEAVTEGSPCHFLGSIMLIRQDTKNNWEINDGQQRIITFSLICAYLCRNFYNKSCSSEENKILRVLFDVHEGHNETLGNADNLSPRITPPRNNKANFDNLIRGHDVKRNGKMIIAWNKINCFFDEQYQNLDWQKKALDYLLNKFIVIRLEIEKSLDANAIFETLNYRGKRLEQVDLVKNYFLSFFNSVSESARLDTMNERFEIIYGNFHPGVVSEYVRCYMQAKYGFISKERFFRETKKRFGNSTQANADEVFDLVKGLADKQNIQIFKTFLRKSANEDVLQKLTNRAGKGNNKRKIDDYLLDLHDYKITRPIIFALFYHALKSLKNTKSPNPKFAYASAKILSSFVQRVSHIGNFKPSTYEENFANLASSIFTKNCVSAKQFFESLKKYDSAGIIDDKYYIEEMSTKSYPYKSVTKFGYILKRVVEYQESGVKIDDKQVSIEHILPKSKVHHSKNSCWVSEFDENALAIFPHWLGNLTLLSKKDNSSKSSYNESFSAKKAIYKNSSYKLTKDICASKKWTPQEIKNRQYQIVKLVAKQIWNFKF